MNTSRRFNNGRRDPTLRLNRRLNRRVLVRLGGQLDHRLDGRAVRPKNPFREACVFLGRYVRMRERAARRDPHLFGPHAAKYHQDTVRLEQERHALAAALERVYGPGTNAAASSTAGADDSIWTQRYCIPRAQRGLFRKWFHETYGD
jgi:hypothetical protein